jgi:hypothetical protein
MSEETFDIENLAAEMTGTVGVSDDAALDQAVPDALADDIEDFDRQADIRDAHLAEDGEQDTDQQRSPATDKRVPLGALQEERNMRQQLQRELEAHRQQVAQLQAYQLQVQAFLAQQQLAQQQEIPDFESDPVGHLEAVKAQFRQELGAVQQQVQLQQFSTQLQGEMATLAPVVTQAEQAVAAEVGEDNYAQAFNHVRQHVQQELAQRYPGAGPEMLARLERSAGVAFVQQCQAQGIDPARYIWERAQALGFHVPNSRAPVKQPNTSLSSLPASGRAPDQRGRLSAKDIATMPQDDFDKLFESMRDTQRPQF